MRACVWIQTDILITDLHMGNELIFVYVLYMYIDLISGPILPFSTQLYPILFGAFLYHMCVGNTFMRARKVDVSREKPYVW